MNMSRHHLLYEGKAKRLYATGEADKALIVYKDDATAFNNQKKDIIQGKGALNNEISAYFFHYLAQAHIPSHFIRRLSATEQLAYLVTIIPLEIICRNRVAGSMAQRLGLEEGAFLRQPIVELCYKNDALQDPLINEAHAVVVLDLLSEEELAQIKTLTLKINTLLQELLLRAELILVDFKLEFGRKEGQVILADEISPDTCRLWDLRDKRKLDKDVFRRDLGSLQAAYEEVWERLKQL